MDLVIWRIYTGPSLTDPSVDPVEIAMTPRIIDMLENVDLGAWNVLIDHLEDASRRQQEAQ
jgi:hypothetical protein